MCSDNKIHVPLWISQIFCGGDERHECLYNGNDHGQYAISHRAFPSEPSSVFSIRPFGDTHFWIQLVHARLAICTSIWANMLMWESPGVMQAGRRRTPIDGNQLCNGIQNQWLTPAVKTWMICPKCSHFTIPRVHSLHLFTDNVHNWKCFHIKTHPMEWFDPDPFPTAKIAVLEQSNAWVLILKESPT